MPATKTKHQRIRDPEARSRSSKRRTRSLLKKGQELSLLTDSDIGIIIFDQTGKLFTYGSSGIEELLFRYLDNLPQRDALKMVQDEYERECEEAAEKSGKKKPKNAELAGSKMDMPAIMTQKHMASILPLCQKRGGWKKKRNNSKKITIKKQRRSSLPTTSSSQVATPTSTARKMNTRSGAVTTPKVAFGGKSPKRRIGVNGSLINFSNVYPVANQV